MARKRNDDTVQAMDEERTAQAIAKAVAKGDCVNFRFLFSPFSPAREGSTERFDTEKYTYLLPDEETQQDPNYREALEKTRAKATWDHILGELRANRPVQVPSELVLLLADNAVRERKFTFAAQAYELLRIRRTMQEEFAKQADQALAANDIPKAVSGYLIATGLAYDYAAFPEPLPMVPNFQPKALMLHGEYPTRPEDCIALQEPDTHANTALEYLLYDPEAAARLRPLPLETRLAFLNGMVRERDPGWDEFAERYRSACGLARDYGERLEKLSASPHQGPESLDEEIDEQNASDPWLITRALLGRTIENGEWWQYLKELAYEHPAAILFVSRQAVGDEEILVPRYRAESPLAKVLDLFVEAPTDSDP